MESNGMGWMDGWPLNRRDHSLPGCSEALIAHAVSLPTHWPGLRTQVPFSYHQASDGLYRGIPPPSSSRPSGTDLSLLDLSLEIPAPSRSAGVVRRLAAGAVAGWLGIAMVAMKSQDAAFMTGSLMNVIESATSLLQALTAASHRQLCLGI